MARRTEWLRAIHCFKPPALPVFDGLEDGMLGLTLDPNFLKNGCLYVIEFGTAWGNNKDTQIARIEYVGPTS